MVQGESKSGLSFPFRGRDVPVSHDSNLSAEVAQLAIQSGVFVSWYTNCERVQSDKNNDDDGSTDEKRNKKIELHSVQIQSVDMFGSRVGFIKIKADATLDVEGDDTTISRRQLPGICFLRGNAVSILVALFCSNDNDDADASESYALLVDQPRVPVGKVSCLELPAGMLDDSSNTIAGTAVQEIEEECGIKIDPSELVDLTKLAFSDHVIDDKEGEPGGVAKMVDDDGFPGIASSPGGSDECLRAFYLEKKVSPEQLKEMKGRILGLNEHGEYITLRVVPMEDIWKISADAKAIASLFLLEQLRREGKLPAAGQLATPLNHHHPQEPEPALRLTNGQIIPQLAFGMYLVPADETGEKIVLDAIQAGYRHFDGASKYENEHTLGRALVKSGLPRNDFFIVGKVWNDAVKAGRAAVRASVEASLKTEGFGDYFDLFFVHWPVPGCYVEAYKELEDLCKEGKIRALGISNFDIPEYEFLMSSGITIPPVVNQMEVSPVMYRPQPIEYFQKKKGIAVGAFKALNRAACLENPVIVEIAKSLNVAEAQVLLRWSLQKGLIVISKTSNRGRMRENRNILHFALNEQDMARLDSLTTAEDIKKRVETERSRKESL